LKEAKMPEIGNRAYKISRVFAALALISIVSFVGLVMLFVWRERALLEMLVKVTTDLPPLTQAPPPGAPPSDVESGSSLAELATVISGLTFLVSSIGTASTVILGWRSERRQTQEFKLKVQQLETEVRRLKQASPEVT
jgi:hypothetical protein